MGHVIDWVSCGSVSEREEEEEGEEECLSSLV